MNARTVATFVVATSFAAGWVIFARAGGSASQPFGSSPVVVELFTSQGCSSCPPADELLRELRREGAASRVVIPLAFHVDYWDSLGWRDPFSSKQWTLRQMQYVRAFRLASAYTPQIVVNGARQMVGSSRGAVVAAIAEESRARRDAKVSIALDGEAIVTRSDRRDGRELVVVIFEQSVTTRIERGENKGRTQTDEAIVRKLVRVPADGAEHRIAIAPEPSWERAKLGYAAFVQDPATMRIEGAAVLGR